MKGSQEPGASSLATRVALLVTGATLLSSCIFQDVREQQARIDAT